MSHLVFVDIDHTLLSTSGEAVAANLAALERADAAGATVVLATARSYIGALPVHEALGLDTPLIVSNGTLVCDPGGQVLMAEMLNPEVAKSLVELFCASPHHWSFRNIRTALLHPEFDLHRAHFRDIRHYRRVPPGALAEALGDCDTLLSAGLFGQGVRAFLDLHDWRGMGLAPSYYPPSHFDYRESMSVVSAAASKGNAARWVQRHLGLEAAPVLSVGDSPDDVTLFALGMGVAPANAAPEALTAAHWVAPHCDEGAVAAALERFVLQARPSVMAGEER